MRKKAVMSSCRILSQNFIGETENMAKTAVKMVGL
jgi:hypothetical protein